MKKNMKKNIIQEMLHFFYNIQKASGNNINLITFHQSMSFRVYIH